MSKQDKKNDKRNDKKNDKKGSKKNDYYRYDEPSYLNDFESKWDDCFSYFK